MYLFESVDMDSVLVWQLLEVAELSAQDVLRVERDFQRKFGVSACSTLKGLQSAEISFELSKEI